MQIIVGLNVGGAELMLKRLAESHADSAKYRHVVVSLTGIGVVGPQMRSAGIEVHSLEMRSIRDAPRVLWALTALIRRVRPDIVQTWMYHSDLLGGIAARAAGVSRVVWGIRTTDVSAGNTRSTAYVMKLCAWLSRRIPTLIVCAAEAAKRAHIAVGYDASRMVVVPNGFECMSEPPAEVCKMAMRERLGIAGDALVIGTVGRFNNAKDHANFVRAAGIALQTHPTLRLLMIGRGLDSANAELLSWIEATGHAERFVLLGERADVKNCLMALDLFCLSSRTEGFPNVLGEAMATGLPCVTTDVGDAAILIGKTGLVVPKEDAASLAAAIGQLLDMTTAARQRLGDEARRRIFNEFSIERARTRFETIYEQLAEKGTT